MKPSWKLNEYEKHLIKRRYASGEPVRDIAGSFDIAPWVVAHHAQSRGVPLRRPQRHRARVGHLP